MATERKILANTQNATKSTGPRTAEGKAVSSKNALKSGQRTLALLPGEDEAAFQELFEAYRSDLLPIGPVESALVDEMVRCHWWKERAERAEARLIQDAVKARRKFESDPPFKTIEPMGESPEAQICSAFNNENSREVLERFQRYTSIYDRRYYRALHELQRLQAQRSGQEVVPPVAVDVTVTEPTTPREVI